MAPISQQDSERLRGTPANIPWTLDDVVVIVGICESRLETLKPDAPSREIIQKILAKVWTIYPELKTS